VKVLFDSQGQRWEQAIERNLWERTGDGSFLGTVTAPVDPADFGIDPLDFL
jgi:hypothetical protein